MTAPCLWTYSESQSQHGLAVQDVAADAQARRRRRARTGERTEHGGQARVAKAAERDAQLAQRRRLLARPRRRLPLRAAHAHVARNVATKVVRPPCHVVEHREPPRRQARSALLERERERARAAPGNPVLVEVKRVQMVRRARREPRRDDACAAAAQTAYVLSADGGSLNKAEMMLLKYSRSAAS